MAHIFAPRHPTAADCHRLSLLETSVLPVGQTLFHVGHHLKSDGTPYAQDELYVGGEFRFSPITVNGVPNTKSYYAGAHPNVAMAEAVLRLPRVGRKGAVMARAYTNRVLVELKTTKPITVFQLCDPNRRAAAPWLDTRELTESTDDHYQATRAWAEAILAQHRHAQGLEWMSRQDNRYACWVFYDRGIPPRALQLVKNHGLLTNEPMWSQLYTLASAYRLVLETSKTISAGPAGPD